MTFPELLEAYDKQFDSGPPIWGMTDDEAIAAMELALETGEAITETTDKNTPDGAQT